MRRGHAAVRRGCIAARRLLTTEVLDAQASGQLSVRTRRCTEHRKARQLDMQNLNVTVVSLAARRRYANA